ncbi:MAG: hypothetical protein CMJ75_13275 [Planctomycetaceae bacterium]|nr:hypothetical protein [Planctomycetaceae bacterium]
MEQVSAFFRQEFHEVLRVNFVIVQALQTFVCWPRTVFGELALLQNQDSLVALSVRVEESVVLLLMVLDLDWPEIEN